MADDGTHIWVGHGVGPTAANAQLQALKRMPEGYRVGLVTTTREDVDETRVHREWVYPNETRRVVLDRGEVGGR